MKNFARIAAAAIGGIAATMTMIQIQKPEPPQTKIVHVPMDESDIDPVRSELRRCQALDATGAEDTRCLRAWAEMRSRFFRSSVSANPSLRESPPTPPETELSADLDMTPDQANDLPTSEGN